VSSSQHSQTDSKQGHTRYECESCGIRFATEISDPACERCGRPTDVLTEIDPVPENSIRVYCHSKSCDFEVVVHEDDADFPARLAEARAKLHSSQKLHPTRYEQPHGWPDETEEDERRICGRLESEEELQVWLESYFEKHGWTAIREVSPAHSDVRADLIVNHEDYGWIGIETKYFKSDGGAKIAKAHHQITRKYRGKKYIGKRINLWAICPYFHGINSQRHGMGGNQQRLRGKIIREMFCKHGMGYIGLDTSTDLLIDFAYSKPIAKIPVNGDEDSRHYENVDIDAIKESVQDKMEKYDYK